MNAQVGSYDVLDSGTIVTLDDEPITVVVGNSKSFVFKFIFKEENGVTPSLDFNLSKNQRELDIILKNFINPTGIGNGKVMRLGTFGDTSETERGLYLNFCIYSITGPAKTKILHYTFMLGESVKNPN